MSTLFIENTGRQTLLFNLTTTAATTVLAGDERGVATIESITWCCKDNASDLSIWLTDGTTISRLMHQEAKTAETHDIIDTWHPTLTSADWLLRAQASVANEINLTIVYAKTARLTTAK